MAGISYTLKRLTEKDNIHSVIESFAYAVFVSSGPWLCSIVSVGAVLIVGPFFAPLSIIRVFQAVIVYNFSFAFLVSGIFSIVICREISDRIYENKFEHITGIFFGSLILLYAISIPVSCYLYFYIASFPLDISLAAIINFLLLVTVWHSSNFLTVLKEYRTISTAFVLGMAIAIIFSFHFAASGSSSGWIINGFNIGFVVILGIIYGTILSEYPKKIVKPLSFLKGFVKYWEFALGGVIFNASIWVDKWVMWSAPNQIQCSSGLVCDQNYSNPMFLAYLTIIPSLAYFFFSIEAEFEKVILPYYSGINNKATLNQIETLKKKVITILFKNIVGFIVIQGTFTVIALMLAPMILSSLDVPMQQLFIFRYGVLGAFFQFFFIMFINVLFYIDARKSILYVFTIFFFLNFLLTYFTVILGYQYYGIGFFVASVVTFIIVAFITFRKMKRLEYHSFIN